MSPSAPIAATIVLAIAVAQSANASTTAEPGAFTGHTAQGIVIRLSAQSLPPSSSSPATRPAAIAKRTLRYQARMRCSDGTTFTDDAFTDLVTIRGDRFKRAVTSDRGAVHTWVTGTLTGRHARGTIRISERYSQVPDAHGDTPLDRNGGTLCDSGTIRWSATAAR